MWASALFLWGEIRGRGSMTDAGGNKWMGKHDGCGWE